MSQRHVLHLVLYGKSNLCITLVYHISEFSIFFVIIKHLKNSSMLNILSCFALDLGDDVPMIECSGYRCPGDNWFHLECLGLDQDDVPDDDFYCSEGCRKRRAYKYCCNGGLR